MVRRFRPSRYRLERVDDDDVDVELLVVPDCPGEAAASALLRGALDDIGLTGVTFETTLVDTQQSAEQRGFVGSPTILINGNDPFAGPGQPAALACRIYSHAHGPAGVPELRALREVLKRAAADDAERRS